MGFGFVKDDEEKNTGPKIKHNYRDRLVHIDWDKLVVGTKVQSVLTGVKGTIVEKSKQWYKIKISWDNKKESYVGHKYYENVIII